MAKGSAVVVLCYSTQKGFISESRSLANGSQTIHRLVPIPSGDEEDLLICTFRRGTVVGEFWPIPEGSFAGEQAFPLPIHFPIHFCPGVGTMEEFSGLKLSASYPHLPLFVGSLFVGLCDESKSGKIWTHGPSFHGVAAFARIEEFALVLTSADATTLATVPACLERLDADDRLRKVKIHGDHVVRPVSAQYVAQQTSTAFFSSFRSLCQMFCSDYDSSASSQSSPVKGPQTAQIGDLQPTQNQEILCDSE